MESGKGFLFEDKTVGGSVPREFMSAVRACAHEAMESGVLAGYPVVDVLVRLTDGSYHDVDSSEMAFKIAASMAAKAAMRKATPVLKEPIMAVEVVTPESFLGDVIGDLNARRAQIQGFEPGRGGTQVVKAMVPLAEMFEYATALRSETQGRASYSMEPARYADIPQAIADELIMKATGRVYAVR
jgi:elongation factor G